MAIRLDEGIGALSGVDLGAVLPAELLSGGGTMCAVASQGLAACHSSVAQARDFTRRVAWQWQVEGLIEDLAMVVTELVTNALNHGLRSNDHQPCPGHPPPAEGWPIDLRLVRTPSRVVAMVSDPAAQEPRRLSPDHRTESGRGMLLVDSLSVCWGWASLNRAGSQGKAVWAVLAVPTV